LEGLLATNEEVVIYKVK